MNELSRLQVREDSADHDWIDVGFKSGDASVPVTIVAGSSSGTEYTEGDTDATLTGSVAMAEGAGNVVTPLQVDASKHLQVDIAADSVGIGGGTQYTEGATDATITGTAIMWEDAADTLTPVSSSKPLPVSVTGGGDATAANQTTIIGHVDGIEGLLTTIDADTSTLAAVDYATQTTLAAINAKLVTGTDIGDVTINNASGASAVNIQDGGNTITVDGTVGVSGTVAVTQSGTWNITNISGTVSLPTGAATAAKQPALGTAGTASSDVITVQGIASMTALKVDGSAVTQPVSGTFWQATQPVSLASVPSHAVTNAGVFAVQVDGAALTALQLIDNLAVAVDGNYLNVNANIAGTDIVGGAGAVAAGVQRVTLASDDPAVVSLAALDNSVDGNYLNVNLNITGTDVSTTNAVPTKGVPSDIDVNGSNANHADKYYTNAGAVTDGIIWSPAAGKRWHVLTLYINVSAAATVTIEDDLAAGDNARWKGELAANSGVVLTYDKEHPFSSGEDAADLLITTTAGNVYVQAVGYEV